MPCLARPCLARPPCLARSIHDSGAKLQPRLNIVPGRELRTQKKAGHRIPAVAGLFRTATSPDGAGLGFLMQPYCPAAAAAAAPRASS